MRMERVDELGGSERRGDTSSDVEDRVSDFELVHIFGWT